MRSDASRYAGSAATTTAAREDGPTTPAGHADERNWRRIAVIAIVVLALAALAFGAWALLNPSKQPKPEPRSSVG